ncbi:MAG TPA: HAD family hydrolase [Terriglobales bacterium]|nr:HAD family hydrolase [Terriglobales bacterium]
MTTIHCSALLFDMDGVLIDSTPTVARVWRRFAEEHGLDPEEVVQRAHGRPSLDTVRHYFPDSDYEQMSREVERQEIADLCGVVALPGSLELLRRLPAERWTVVTSATHALAEVRLRAAGLPVPERIVTADHIENGKPHPEPYLKAAAALGFSPAQCVVVEDVPAGVRAGKAAGAKVIAFPTTVQPSELIHAGADWILHHCADIVLLDATEDLRLGLAVHDSQ